MEIKPVSLSEKYQHIDESWSPKIVGELKNQLVKIAKVKGDFVMYHYENEDGLFIVFEDELFIELESETIQLKQDEFVVIPVGVAHRPYAPKEVKLMLFEPKNTLNTGNIRSKLTKKKLEHL